MPAGHLEHLSQTQLPSTHTVHTMHPAAPWARWDPSCPGTSFPVAFYRRAAELNAYAARRVAHLNQAQLHDGGSALTLDVTGAHPGASLVFLRTATLALTLPPIDRGVTPLSGLVKSMSF